MPTPAQPQRPSTPTLRRPRGASEDSGTSTSGSGSGVLAIKGRLLEWHSMTDEQRSEAWTGLVEWVAWLHDRYELSIASRLPECWPQHPGLIEELWALKIWREALYTTDTETGVLIGQEAGGLAQHARYWHTDLRNLFGQIRFYAERCAAEHRGGQPLSERSKTDLKAGWLEVDPTSDIAAPASQPTRTARPTSGLPASEMHLRLELGSARSLDLGDDKYARSFDDWWARDGETGDWNKVTHTDLVRRLENLAATEQP
jgi:hypothetical protein